MGIKIEMVDPTQKLEEIERELSCVKEEFRKHTIKLLTEFEIKAKIEERITILEKKIIECKRFWLRE